MDLRQRMRQLIDLCEGNIADQPLNNRTRYFRDPMPGNEPAQPAAVSGPKVGDRFRLIHNADRYPDGIIPKGSTGRITEVQDDLIVGRMDKHFPELDEWDNELQFPIFSDDVGGNTFEDEAEIINI